MAAESWMLRDVIEVLGWTLLHFVWQGLAVSVLLAGSLLLLRRASAQTRYLLACAALVVLAICPFVTTGWLASTYRPPMVEPLAASELPPRGWTAVDDGFGWEDGAGGGADPGVLLVEPPPTTADKPQVIQASTSAAAVRESPRLSERLHAWLTPALPWLVTGWLFGVAILSLRLLSGWLGVQRLRRGARQPAAENWQTSLRNLAERLRVTRSVKLVESALVEVPTVIGWLSPIILLPATAMTGLTTDQLEALLAHELAHVRRHDYLINLLQSIVETLLFYHPAVWWISHRIRLEREHCCDDLAVQVCGDGLTYAKALVALEELRAPKLGLAMSSRGGSLLTRVARLLGQAEQQRRPTGWSAGLLSLVLLTMAGALGAGLLTPSEKPTAVLPNNTSSATTESTDTNEETSGPTERRGQESSAERETGQKPARQSQTQIELERAKLQILRQRAENDIPIRLAQKSAEVAKAEWHKMLQSNRKVPGSIPATEIERAKLNYEKAVLQIEQAEHEQRVHQFELATALGQKTEDDTELSRKTLDIRWRLAKATTAFAKAEYDIAVSANRRVSSAVAEPIVAKLRTNWEEALQLEVSAMLRAERAPNKKRVADELLKLTELDFDDQPLSDVLTFIGDFHNIPVVIDLTPTQHRDAPVTLTIQDTDLAEGLMLLLHPLRLSYCIDEGQLLITTPEEVQRRGHKLPRSFADELVQLHKAESTIAWAPLLRGVPKEPDAALIPKLAALLDSENEVVQRCSARLLTRFAKQAVAAQPGLEKLTKSKDVRVARAAWFALVEIGREDFSTLRLLLTALDSEGEAIGVPAVALLVRFDGKVWTELTKLYPTASLRIRTTFAAALRPPHGDRLAVALLAAADTEHMLRRTALRNYYPPEPAAEWIEALRARLKDDVPDIRVMAAGRLLHYGHAESKTLELLLAEVAHEDQNRSRDALQNFRFGRPTARLTIDALDAFCRAKSESQRLAARRALAVMYRVDGDGHPIGQSWGPTHADLRTRISPLTLKSPYWKPFQSTLGEPIKLKLELTNVGDKPFDYDAQQAGVNRSLTVIDADGRDVPYVGLTFQTEGTVKTIKPGETHVIVAELDLTAQYRLKQPGTYLVQWTRGLRDINADDATTPFVLSSNVLTLEVLPAEINAVPPNARDDASATRPGRFEGRVRLKTEKPLPDLEKVDVPAGKLLDESLVFSKDGGLANVFVYLRKPTFTIDEPADVAEPKPFVLIDDGGKFWPHAAFVRVGRPVLFENRGKELSNFRLEGIRNGAYNHAVGIQDRVKVATFKRTETIPIRVKNDLKPWMLAHVLTLEHPFAAITDDNGRFAIDGLPPGEHDFRVWHERVGWLEKSLVITIKPGEDARSDLEYAPDRLKLTEAEVLSWGKRLIDAKWIPQLRVPRPAVPPPQDAKQSEVSNLKSQISDPKPDAAKLAIERGIAFLKAQQQDDGTWQGTPADGVTALCAAALLQAGVKADDPVMQRALAHLRKVEQSLSYTVALQTMVFCWASPKEDAELIRRNVAWLEKAQVTEGELRGAWSYTATNTKFGDGSCSRFAVMGLHAAKRAGFEVQAETWRHVSDYWLTTQKDQGLWGYTPQSAPTPTMTLAGIACLATANRYLPQEEQTKIREAAIRKPAEYLEKVIPDLTKAGFAFYALQSLERAGHISGIKEFGKLDWQADLTKRLLETQHHSGFWKGSTPTESELVATSFALLALTGQPEPKLFTRRFRIEPRDVGNSFQLQTSRIMSSVPPHQRTEISGGVRIEFIESDGLKCRIEADRAIIESDAGVYDGFDLNPGSDVMRIECIGSVKCEDRRGAESTQLTAERLWFDVRRNYIRINKAGNLP